MKRATHLYYALEGLIFNPLREFGGKIFYLTDNSQDGLGRLAIHPTTKVVEEPMMTYQVQAIWV